jgi:hypothetical protein
VVEIYFCIAQLARGDIVGIDNYQITLPLKGSHPKIINRYHTTLGLNTIHGAKSCHLAISPENRLSEENKGQLEIFYPKMALQYCQIRLVREKSGAGPSINVWI